MRHPRYVRDYARYWFRTPGAQPRNCSTWLADAVWAVHRVHPDEAFVKGLLATLPVAPPPIPRGNLAYNPGGKPFPKASASYTSRFDKVEWANNGVISFTPTPHDRWTSYESPNKTDWLVIDFAAAKEVRRVELALYDDGGGVQAPRFCTIQYWTGKEWADVSGPKRTPEQPTGGQFNEVRFARVKTSKVRVVFTHRGKARSGVSEIFIWKD